MPLPLSSLLTLQSFFFSPNLADALDTGRVLGFVEGAGLLTNLGIKERTVLGAIICLGRWDMCQFKQSQQQ